MLTCYWIRAFVTRFFASLSAPPKSSSLHGSWQPLHSKATAAIAMTAVDNPVCTTWQQT